MSDQWRGPGWWYASDGKWYPPGDASPSVGSPDTTPSVDLRADLVDGDVIDLDELEAGSADAVPAVVHDRELAHAGTLARSKAPEQQTGWVRDAADPLGDSDEPEVGAWSSAERDLGPVIDPEAPRLDESRAVSQPESRRGSGVFVAALLLAVLSGTLASLWVRERSIADDLRVDLAVASDGQAEIDLADLEDALQTAQIQNEQLEQQVADMSALVLALPAGRLTEIVVPFDPAFADESNGRLIAMSADGEYVIWSDGADSPITDSGRLPGVPTGLFAGSARSWIPTEDGVVEILTMRPEIAPEAAIEYGPLVHVVPDDRSYWSFNTELGQVVRLERSGGAVSDAVAVPSSIVDMTIGAGSVWALGEDGLVYRINTADRTLQSFDLGPDLISITAGPDALWTLSAADGSLRRVDPVTGSILVTVPVGRDPIDAMFAGSSVWVGLRSGSSMIEVDTATSAVVSRTELSSEPAKLFEGDSGVYVSTVGEGSPLLRIDSLSNSVDAASDVAPEGADGE